MIKRYNLLQSTRRVCLMALLGMLPGLLAAQSFFKEIVIQSDTNFYYYSKNSIHYMNDKLFFFKVKNNHEICELTVYPENAEKISRVELQPSSDFTILDSVQWINGKYFRGKIQFNNLYETKFARFVFRITDETGNTQSHEVRLYPYFETALGAAPDVQELYDGEDKVIEIPASNLSNIRLEEHWVRLHNVEYKVSAGKNSLQVTVHPTVPGSADILLNLKTLRPYLDNYGHLSYEIAPVNLKFSILPGRINFLNMDKNEFFMDPQFNANIEVQADFNRSMAMRKTYRIESQQEPGGRLIAELFTQSYIGNSNKVLCFIRPYALHKVSEGYLYIKENDITKYVTNFNVIQRPAIEKVSILREGEDWTGNLAVNPGEKIEVKIEGSGLTKADFLFDVGVGNFASDTTRRSDNVAFYFLKIPVDIVKKKVSILMNNDITRYELLVREYQVPKDLDFVYLSYEDGKTALTDEKFNKPVLKREPVKDINIIFDQRKIDSNAKIYGKQYLSIQIKIFNAAKDLIEIQNIENIVVCPGENSPRYSYYDLKDCRKTSVNLNEYLLHKTYDLDGWSQIEVTIRHVDAKYATPGFLKKVVIIKERMLLLDMQISFPAGLLVKRFGETGIGKFTGISTAFLVQLSFYDRQRIGRIKPYKVGAGLIALDIFNVNAAQRDLGLVVLGSLMPVRNSRFSFPIYCGFGYLIQSTKWFAVFGPGIQFNF